MPPRKKVQLKVGNLVTCRCEALNADKQARILEFRDDGRTAYVTFLNEDKRCDDCIPVSQLKAVEDTIVHEDCLLTRKRRKMRGDDIVDDDADQRVELFEETGREVTKIRNIDSITLGTHTIKTWYYSPYPHPYHDMSHLYICEYCLKYFASEERLEEHRRIVRECTPPGREVYRDQVISVYEMKGRNQKLPCQCLCLLGKLFIDHKTLFYDVEGFTFYVLCKCDNEGAHIAGFFSKENCCEDDNILSCIAVLPPYQGCGYGSFMIALSYELSKRCCKLGSPEHPISDLGRAAFHSYWKRSIAKAFVCSDVASLNDIMKMTWIAKNDLIEVLKELGLVRMMMGSWELTLTDDEDRKRWANEVLSRSEKINFEPRLLIWMPNDEHQYL